MDQSEIDKATRSHKPDHSAFHNVYTYYGFAGYWAQIFELAMLNVVAAIRLADMPSIDKDTYQGAFRNLNRKTLGMLLNNCRVAKHINIPEKDERLLQEALEKRNSLTHRFFSVHNAELSENEAIVVNELREISALFASAQQVAQSVYASIMVALDIDEELILEEGLAWENVILKESD